jgi:hypothetical protein
VLEFNPMTKITLTEIQVRTRLEALLHRKLTEEEWMKLISLDLVERVQTGEKPLTWLRLKHERLAEMKPEHRETLPPALPEKSLLKARADVLTSLAAKAAADDPDVHRFRSDVLASKLVTASKVVDWIKEKAAVEGPATLQLSITAPGSFDQVDLIQMKLASPLTLPKGTLCSSVGYESLSYLGSEFIEHINVRADGVLDRLRRLAIVLRERFGWLEAEATMFILTGRVPPVRPLIVSERSGLDPLRRRIVMEIDPITLPILVVKAYQLARQRLAKARGHGRSRNLSEKHLRLAEWSLSRPDEESWEKRCGAWNEKHKSWAYSSTALFKRDSQTACRRLVGANSLKKG